MTTNVQTVRRHDLLMRLLRLSRDQGEALQGERIDVFLSMMNEREWIIADLMEQTDLPQPTNIILFPTMAKHASDPDIDTAIGLLISSVLAQDEKNERLLHAQMEKLRDALGRLNQGYTTARGYASAMPRESVGRELDIAF